MRREIQSGLALAFFAAASLVGCNGEEMEPTQVVSDDAAIADLIDEARRHAQRGNLRQSGLVYDQALEIDENSPRIWVDVARLRYSGGEQIQALAAADRALVNGPDFPPALTLKGQLVRDAFGFSTALAWFERAADLAAEDPSILTDLAATLGDMGRHRDMLRFADRAAKGGQEQAQVQFLYAVLAARASEPTLASGLLPSDDYSDGSRPAAVILRGIIDLQQGSHDAAADAFEELLKLQPSNIRARELLAHAMWEGGRDREIVDRFGTEVLERQSSFYLTNIVARAYERMGDRERAIAILTHSLRADNATELRILSIDGPLPQTTAKVRAMLNRGDLSGARAYTISLRKRFPGSSDVLVLAGDTALANSDYENAISEYFEAARIRRTWPLVQKMIYALEQLGDEEAANALLVDFVKGEPRNADALSALARRAVHVGDWERSAQLLDSAMAIGGESAPSMVALRFATAKALGRDSDRWGATARQVWPGSFVDQ